MTMGLMDDVMKVFDRRGLELDAANKRIAELEKQVQQIQAEADAEVARLEKRVEELS